MNRFALILVLLAAVTSQAWADTATPVNVDTGMTTMSAVVAGWAKSTGKVLRWDVPSEYDYPVAASQTIDPPISDADIRRKLRELNQISMDSWPSEKIMQSLVVCIRKEYIAVRLNGQPTDSCPDTATGVETSQSY